MTKKNAKQLLRKHSNDPQIRRFHVNHMRFFTFLLTMIRLLLISSNVTSSSSLTEKKIVFLIIFFKIFMTLTLMINDSMNVNDSVRTVPFQSILHDRQPYERNELLLDISLLLYIEHRYDKALKKNNPNNLRLILP